MNLQSVELDDEAAAALHELTERTGLPDSEVIRGALLAYRVESHKKATKSPAEFLMAFDLGEGDSSIPPAREAKAAVKRKLMAEWEARQTTGPSPS